MVYTDEVDINYVQVPDPKGGYSGSTMQAQTSDAVRRAKALVRYNPDSRVEEANQKIAEARRTESAADEVKKAHEKELSEAKQRIADLTSSNEVANDRGERWRAEAGEAQEKARKIERDLAAVRMHFGAKEFDEALAAAKEKDDHP